VAGGSLVYALVPRDDDGSPPPARPHVVTLRTGEVAVRAEAATRCEASVEGGFENLSCTRLGGGRYSFVFYEDAVQVFGPKGEPTDPDLTLRWNSPR
jgi:hypothetical protein